MIGHKAVLVPVALLLAGAGTAAAVAQTTIVQSNTGVGCSSVCINGNCTSTCGDSNSEAMKGNRDVVDKELDITGFSEVVSADIDTTVIQGESFSVTVTADSNLIEEVEVTRSGETLNLQLADGYYQQATLKVEVVMPDLKRLTQRGAASLRFQGFDQSSLALNVEGTGDVIGNNNLVTNLVVTSSGTSNLDLRQSELTNAEVFVSGTSNLQLNFAHSSGILSGRIDGVSALRYCGNPQNRVTVSGIADIQRVNCS